jgi:Leucine-rich repeat (LRR) protein
MTLSSSPVQDQETKILAQKDKVLAIYELLTDLPDEKVVFEARRGGLTPEVYSKDPAILRWMLTRIRDRIREASLEIQAAVARAVDGVLDLSRKNLCDLTVKDFSAPLNGIWKVILSGNHLRTLPPFLAQKPFIEKCESSGNINDIQELFVRFRTDNKVNLDTIETLKALIRSEFEGKEHFVALYEEIIANTEKLPIKDLAQKVNRIFEERHPPVSALVINPHVIEGESLGGVRSFIPLNPFWQVRELDLSHCYLEHNAPARWLVPLINLKVLKLSHTPIESVPIGIKEIALEVLDISSTRIRSLPDWLGEMKSLKRLNVADLPITHLPSSLAQLDLSYLNVDGTRITELPYLYKTGLTLSLKRTGIEKLPVSAYDLFRRQQILIDEANAPSLILQKDVISRFHYVSVAHLAYLSENFKKTSEVCPRIIKVNLVGLEYILMIAALSACQVFDVFAIPFTMGCSRSRGMSSSAFDDFRRTNARLMASLFYMYFLFHLLPIKRKGNDVQALLRLMVS